MLRWAAHSNYALLLGLLVVGMDLAGLQGSPLPMLIGGAAALLYGAFKLVGGVVKDWERYQRIYEQARDEPLSAPYEPPYDSWHSTTRASWHAISDPKLDARLAAESEIKVRRVTKKWTPGTAVEAVRALRRLDVDFDQDKIRLSSELLASTGEVVLEKVPYSAFLVTNKLGIVNIKEYGDTKVLEADDVILRGGLLPSFERSRCSNHLGADTLAVVSDGRILVTRQSAKNQLSGRLLAPSGSGSMDWKDLRKADDLISVVKRAMRREMLEELGIGKADAPDFESIRVLGFARLTHLGGKPQFFGVTRLNGASERIRGIEKRYIADHVTIDFTPKLGVADLLRAVDEFEKARVFEFSFPLYLNLQIFKRWVFSDPGAAKWLGLPA